MVYWEFLVAGKFEFTQFDPVVAEKHSGLQGLIWEENSIKRVEHALNWIKSFDEIRSHRDQFRTTLEFCCNSSFGL